MDFASPSPVSLALIALIFHSHDLPLSLWGDWGGNNLEEANRLMVTMGKSCDRVHNCIVRSICLGSFSHDSTLVTLLTLVSDVLNVYISSYKVWRCMYGIIDINIIQKVYKIYIDTLWHWKEVWYYLPNVYTLFLRYSCNVNIIKHSNSNQPFGIN